MTAPAEQLSAANVLPYLDQRPPFLSAAEAAPVLRQSENTTRLYMLNGDLPTQRIGKRLYIPQARLRELLGLPPMGFNGKQRNGKASR